MKSVLKRYFEETYMLLRHLGISPAKAKKEAKMRIDALIKFVEREEREIDGAK